MAPNVLYGANIIDLTKTEIEKLQRAENGVYRQILAAARYAQIAALRGEIGAMSMKNRIIEGQWKYLSYILRNDENVLWKEIGEITLEQGTNRWIKELENDLRKREGCDR